MIKPGDFAGNYIHYGVREHGMAAAMNGLALHGGIVPYGGTFLVFSDYCRPSIRLSALMGQRVIYVMTHDSIGLGEDGPTHQPVEHLAALRAMPNLYVMRPADSVECAECWELALLAKTHADDPGADAPGRCRCSAPTHTDENLSAKGAYVLIEPQGRARRDADRHRLRAGLGGPGGQGAGRGGDRAPRSCPCRAGSCSRRKARATGMRSWARRRASRSRPRSPFGWERWLGPDGAFIGMHGFGASAPAQDLYKHFGITAEAVAAAARDLIGKTKR